MKWRKAASRKLDVQMPQGARAATVTVQNINVPGYTSRVNEAKYTAMRGVSAGSAPAFSWGDADADVRGGDRAPP